MTEEWREVIGWPYEASTLGRVRRIARCQGSRQQILKPARTARKTWRWQVAFSAAGRRRSFTVAQVVALAFLGPRSPEKEINHKDGDRLNDRADNLEYVMLQQNREHAVRFDLMSHVTRRSKLTPQDVVEIRRRRAAGESRRSVAVAFGICTRQVSIITARKQWRAVA